MDGRSTPPYPPHLLRQIVDGLPGQIAYWDKDLICRYANRTYLEWFSHSIDTIFGISMLELLGPELFARNKEPIAGVLRGEPQSFVRPIIKPDGSAANVDVRYAPARDADGQISGFYVSVNDVTAFKRIEAQLRDKEAELTTLVAKRDEAISWLEMAEGIAHVGHWRMCLGTGAVTWSDEMYRIHGVTRDGFVPTLRTASRFFHPEDRARIRASMRRARVEATTFEDVARVSRPDGEFRYVRIRGTAGLGSAAMPAMLFGVLVDITDQQRAERALRAAYDRLEALAHVDGLTGISNRRRFDEMLNVEWHAAMREGQALSVVLIDVDHFKSFNDTYGHQAGDDCLCAVAEAIRSTACRPQDVVARYGGEEFVMLLPVTDRGQAAVVAERARAAVEALGKTHTGSRSGVVTISAGVGCVDPLRSGDLAPDQVIADADTMLYRAKEAGRNVVVALVVPATRVTVEASTGSTADAANAPLRPRNRSAPPRRPPA